MNRPISNINCNYNLVNKNNPSFSGNYKTGINFIVKSEKLPVNKLIKQVKEYVFNRAGKIFSQKSKAAKLPVANKPLTAAMALEKGKDFDSKFVEETLRNAQYGPGSTTYTDTTILINRIPKEFLPNKPWDPPMTDSGHLTHSAKESIIKQVENSNMPSYEKESLIRDIKRNYIDETGKNDIITFAGAKENVNVQDLNPKDFDISDAIDKHLDIGIDAVEHYGQAIEHSIDHGVEQGLEHGIEQSLENGLDHGIDIFFDLLT